MDSLQIMYRAYETRKALGCSENGFVEIFNILPKDNVSISKQKLGSNISGLCYKYKGNVLFVINSQMSLGRQRFTLAHEIYHWRFDENPQSVCLLNGNSSAIEKDADEFASYFLVPQLEFELKLNSILSERKLTIQDIIELEQYYGISHQAMLMKLEKMKVISESEKIAFQKNIKKNAALLGYSTAIYEATNEETTTGILIQKIFELNKENKISDSYAERLLINAGREDLLYDEYEEDIYD